jgi:hypothetical protein
MIRSPRSWRIGRLGLALVAAAALVYRYPPLAATTIVQYVPTDVLLSGEGTLGIGTPLEMRDEIRRRADAFELDDAQIDRFVRLLVNDLRDDQLAGNAADALDRLQALGWYSPQPLIDALNSPDTQQRCMAAEALRNMPGLGPPPEALIRAAVQDLRSDDRRWNEGRSRIWLYDHLEQVTPALIEAMSSDDSQQRRAAASLLRHATLTGPQFAALIRGSVGDLHWDDHQGTVREAFIFLFNHADAAEPELLLAMAGSDAQQRLLAAAVAGCAGRIDLMSTAVPILASHLADNHISGDAIVAARGLAGFGPDVVPLLRPFRTAGDEQQRQQIEYIIRRLTANESPVTLQRELPLARLTREARDALSVRPDQLDLPRIPLHE